VGNLLPLRGIALRGIAAALPLRRETTAECGAFRSPEDGARFAAATGIEERRIAPPEQCASDLCAAAAEALVERLGWERSSVGLLVMVTQSPDHILPATAILLQHRLGLPRTCVAYDMNLGCSAFPFGLAQVASAMAALGIPRGLLLIGDISSRGCNPMDPSSYPLFGDAGSAIGLELDGAAGAMHFDLNSDGAGGAAICSKSYGLAGRYPVSQASLVAREVGEDRHPRCDLNTRLSGADIFGFSIREAPASIARVLERAGVAPAAVDHVVLHQANKMINDIVCRKSGIEAAKALSSLRSFGNTGSASIPVTLCAAMETVRQPSRILACGFGVGLSWGSVVLELAADAPLLLVETDAVFRPDLQLDLGDL